MKDRKFILHIFFFLFLITNLNAQERIIHGVVTTFKSVPVSNVEVTVKSTGQVVTTDTLGRFWAGCNYSDKLLVSATGFYKKRIKVGKQIKFVAVNLVSFPQKKGKAYNIGYEQILDDKKTTAVDNVSSDDVDFGIYNNMYDLILGRIPGVQIENGQIIIRGVNSVYGSSAATIIVDGVTSNESVLNTISPRDVQKVSVIKDGSAAIYGFKGSNGVLIIETKNPQRKYN